MHVRVHVQRVHVHVWVPLSPKLSLSLSGGAQPVSKRDPPDEQPKLQALKLQFADLQAKFTSLQSELEAVKSRHSVELELTTAKVKLELQPQLRAAYTEGYNACKAALQEARSMLM